MENISLIREDYQGFANYCINLVNMKDTRDEFVFQSIRHGIHDLRPIYSGYTSIAAIKAHNGRVTKMCKEHFNGRANSSRRIMQMIRDKTTLPTLIDFIKESCKVHYTTSEENMRLVEYQNKENYNWMDAYNFAGIKLVKFEGAKIWYKIDGIKYFKTKNELQELFGVTLYKLDSMIEEKGEELIIS